MAEEQKKVEPGAATEEKEEKAEVGQMKRGDYMIHVFIEQARQLKVPEGNTVDPLVEISCMGEKKFSTAKDDISGPCTISWNEHFFFEPKNVEVDAIEQAKITLRVMDKGYFKNAVIGCYEFDVAFIYFMKDHSLMHKWLALSNPNSEVFNEVAGYLKISITIATAGDEQIQITEDDAIDRTDESILMPPSIRPEFYQIKFRFFRAEKLPALDMNLNLLQGVGKGSIDAYVSTTFMNKKLKTDVKVQQEGGSVDWNQEFLIPCQVPIMSSRITFKVFDEDKLGDEIVGSLLFSLKECIEKKNGHFFWKNVYGAPVGKHGDNTDRMNEIPEAASTWKGRILMQIFAEKTEKPQLLCKNIEEEVIAQAAEYYREREYEIIAEIGQGISLPNAEKYSVMIKIGDIELKTEKANIQENNYNRWSHRFKQQIIKMPYVDEYDIGRVFIYLMSGDNPICYHSGNIDDFLEPNPEMKWIQLVPDLAIGKVALFHKAGMISMKMSIHNKEAKGSIQFEKQPAWSKPPPKRLSVYQIRAYLFQCRDLPAADSDGTSDPYAIIWDQSKTQKKTKIIYDNLNPMFYETVELTLESFNIDQLPPFIIDIYDWDMGPMDDDFLGRCVIHLKDSAHQIDCPDLIKENFKDNKELQLKQMTMLKKNTVMVGEKEIQVVPKPKWHGCKLKPGSPDCGEILIGFSIASHDFKYGIPFNYLNLKDQVPFEEFTVSLNILGLRNLQSIGILPVKKAYIVFNIKSLVPPDEGTAMENIKTQPNCAGANPTINTLIEFKVPLPTDPLFCPRLACSVHDYIFKGFSQPLLGTFIIPIGDLIHALKQEREEETEAISEIITQLDLILRDQGISLYNVKEEKMFYEDLDEVKSQQKSLNQEVKDNIVGQKGLKKPLLVEDKENDNKSQNQQNQKVHHGPKSVSRHTHSENKSQGGKAPKSKVLAALKQKQDDKFSSGKKAELLSKHKEEAEKNKREFEEQRKKEELELKRLGSGKEAAKNILQPQYELDERLNVYREKNIPPSSLFLPLGWDENPEMKRKHYRRYYADELENIKEVMPLKTPFHTYDIKRGQSRGNKKSLFTFGFGSKKQDESGSISTEQVVGIFKGIVTVQSDKDKEEYIELKKELMHQLKLKLNSLSIKKIGKPIQIKTEMLDTLEGRNKFELMLEPLGVSHLNISKRLADLESDEILKRMMMSQTKCIVRLYVVSAYDLASRDIGSDSDPYLLVTLGSKTYNDRDNYQLDEPNPQFNKHFDFEAKFPGCPPLVIKAMDFDDLFGDDLIGETIVDLEDRFFSPEWQSIKHKPVEYRQIYHQSTAVSQGVIKMWVEIHPVDVPQDQVQAPIIYDITPKPDDEFEVRLVVFDTLEVIAMDAEGTSDVYIRAFFDSKKESHETDTHYRCQNGKASFNYRLLYQLKVSDTNPSKNLYNLTLQAFDRDFFSSNDIIGTATINLKNAIEDCRLSQRPLPVNKKYYNDYMKDQGTTLTFKDDNSFFVDIIGTKDGKQKVTGKVRIQIDILPKGQAEQNKVGEARQEPNHSPFLPPPVGRFSFSLNPLKMFQQLVGPEIRRKIYCGLCCILCCMILISVAPMIISQLITNAIMSIF